MRRPVTFALLLAAAVLFFSTFAFYHYGRSVWHPLYLRLRGHRTVADVIQLYGEAATERLTPAFAAAAVAYPPTEVSLLALKAERVLEVWASHNGSWRFIKQYAIKGASGITGPKLREGDRQVPEGVYRIIGLNPNSSYHLSMKLNYPNAFDLRQAKREGRSNPGSNIFIHGKRLSVGCLAMGDEAIEELFVLVAAVGKHNARVVIAPYDPRNMTLPAPRPDTPRWLPELYDLIATEFKAFRRDET